MYVLQVEGQECELLDAGRHAARKSVITEISIINLHPKSMQVNEFNMKYNNWGPVLRDLVGGLGRLGMGFVFGDLEHVFFG